MTDTQAQISVEIAERHTAYNEEVAAGKPALTGPMLDFSPYRSSILRHPTKNPRLVDPETIELVSPAFGQRDVSALEADLTIQAGGDPLGERMVVTGRVLDGWGQPVRRQLVEIWQANASGRYIHQRDQ
ncbi:MAG: protocatechuate 3,4-dioxygenase subunit beta, partial [Leifsonia sp.]